MNQRANPNISCVGRRSDSSIGDYHVGKPLNNETFNSINEESSKEENRQSDTLSFNETHLHPEKVHEEASMLTNEISAILPAQQSKIRKLLLFNSLN